MDLLKNKESYTAFDGVQVWSAIYKDNCMVERFKNIDVSRTCSDHTLLFQLVSGLHTSINMHVAMNFVDTDKNETVPNYQLFLRMIGQHPDRVRNLYFLYSLVLKAIHRAENLYRGVDFSSEHIQGSQERSKVLI